MSQKWMTIAIIPSENCLFCTSFRAWINSLFFPLVLCNSEHSSICLLKFNTLEVRMSFPGTGFLSELFIQAFLLIIHSNHNSTSGESDRRELKKRTKNNWSMGDIVPATSLYIRKNQRQTKRGWLFLAACSLPSLTHTLHGVQKKTWSSMQKEILFVSIFLIRLVAVCSCSESVSVWNMIL